jgi:hypothetical protein
VFSRPSSVLFSFDNCIYWSFELRPQITPFAIFRLIFHNKSFCVYHTYTLFLIANKTDRHDITDILLKVALNTINQTKPKLHTFTNTTYIYQCCKKKKRLSKVLVENIIKIDQMELGFEQPTT